MNSLAFNLARHVRPANRLVLAACILCTHIASVGQCSSSAGADAKQSSVTATKASLASTSSPQKTNLPAKGSKIPVQDAYRQYQTQQWRQWQRGYYNNRIDPKKQIRERAQRIAESWKYSREISSPRSPTAKMLRDMQYKNEIYYARFAQQKAQTQKNTQAQNGRTIDVTQSDAARYVQYYHPSPSQSQHN